MRKIAWVVNVEVTKPQNNVTEAWVEGVFEKFSNAISYIEGEYPENTGMMIENSIPTYKFELQAPIIDPNGVISYTIGDRMTLRILRALYHYSKES